MLISCSTSESQSDFQTVRDTMYKYSKKAEDKFFQQAELAFFFLFFAHSADGQQYTKVKLEQRGGQGGRGGNDADGDDNDSDKGAFKNKRKMKIKQKEEPQQVAETPGNNRGKIRDLHKEEMNTRIMQEILSMAVEA